MTDILLVEDNPLEVELTLRPLQELDPASRIEVARDGEEALDFLLGGVRSGIGSGPRFLVWCCST